MLTRTLAIAIALTAISTTACSGGEPSPATTPTNPTTAVAVATHRLVPSAPPKPVVWTIAEAGQRYLAYVKPSNALLDTWGKLPNTGPLTPYPPVAKRIADSEDVFARNLSRGQWPASALPAIRTLIPTILKERIYWSMIATTTTLAGLQSITLSAAFTDASTTSAAAASAVRIALNLPTN
jgi:hypothetical protein